MNKLIQYLHGNNWIPACVASLSIRRNGCLAARHTLYTTDPALLDNPYIHHFFDAVELPCWDWKALFQSDLDMGSNHPSHDGRIPAWPADFRKYALAKYACFLYETCEEGDAVLYVDNDMLCLREVLGALPRPPYTWAARYWSGGPGVHRLNGGLYAKNHLFDNTLYVEPLVNPVALREAFKIHRLDDEACASWSMAKTGVETLYKIPLRYNKNVVTVPPKDVSLLHFNAPEKPWFGYYLSVTHKQFELWEATAREVAEICGYPLDGEGVPERWRWPFLIGEYKRHKRRKMGMIF